MAWVFVPGLADSNSELASPFRDTAPSLGLSGTPVQPQALSRAWQTKCWLRRLSGLTCEPSTADAGVDAWISSLRASRVSPFPSRGASEGTTTPGISGRTSRGSLARWAVSGCSLRTSRGSSQPSLLTDGAPSITSWVTSASWVTRSRQESSQRQRWARRIFGSASSSWPTARAEDSESPGPHGGAADGLTSAVAMWPTPNRQDEKWRETPNMAVARREAGKQESIGNAALSFPSSLPDGTSTPAGEPSSPSGPTSRRRLNPGFVEWLMGWPLGWTDLDSPFSATEWSRWWLGMRCSLSRLGWRLDNDPCWERVR